MKNYLKAKQSTFDILIKSPLIVFFSKKKSSSIKLVNKINQKDIKATLVDTLKELLKLLKSQRTLMVIIDDDLVTEYGAKAYFLYGFLSLTKVPIVLVIGDEEKLNKIEDINFDTVISETTPIEEKLDEIDVFCEACKIILTSEDRVRMFSDTNLNSDELQLKIQQELQQKNRRISSLYMQILEYKNILKKCYSDWESLNLSMDDDDVRKYHFSLKSLTHDVRNEWDIFSEHFVEVHPSFFKKLTNIAPELSEENLKMCAYIKMGISNTEIANYMNILHASVKRAQLRIKKKLNLPENKTLRKYIYELE